MAIARPGSGYGEQRKRSVDGFRTWQLHGAGAQLRPPADTDRVSANRQHVFFMYGWILTGAAAQLQERGKA